METYPGLLREWCKLTKRYATAWPHFQAQDFLDFMTEKGESPSAAKGALAAHLLAGTFEVQQIMPEDPASTTLRWTLKGCHRYNE